MGNVTNKLKGREHPWKDEDNIIKALNDHAIQRKESLESNFPYGK